MRKRNLPRPWRRLRPRVVWLLLALLIFGGCQAKEPPLSPAAKSFKKEIRDCLQRLSPELATPLIKRDVAALNEVLARVEPEASKLCRMCPFRMGVLDKAGETLTVHPYKADAVGNFSNYEVVIKTLKDQQINQQRLFLQDGSQVFIVCDPIKQGSELVGILVLSMSAQEAKQRWGITEAEFLSLDFNQK